jgi:hypothetical protein
LFTIFSFLLFSLKGFFTLDPDFGWHLKMGQLITSSGIPATDPFSYTMANFPFVDHEWLSNIYIYFLYNHIGQLGLALIFGVMATASLVICLPKKSQPIIKYFLLILAIASVIPFAGIRPQVQTWLFLAILIKVIFDQEWWRKLRFFLPPFFLLWANLHGGFAVGLATLTVIMVVKSIGLRKVNITDLLIVVSSWLVTLINPYGLRLWGEIISTQTDTNLRWRIAEWMPSIFSFNFPFIFLACLSGTLIFRYRKKYLPEELIVYLAFLIEAVLSVRNIPLWTIIALPLTFKAFSQLTDEVSKVQKGTERLQKSLLYAMPIAILILISQIYFDLRSSPNQNNFYPSQAVSYLKNNLPPGNIFSDYNWGGYLIWKLPEKKTFIDGRMPSWRYPNCPPNESCNAMQDYLDISNGKKDYHQFFDKYQINTVLAAIPQKPTLFDRIAMYFQKSNFNLTTKLLQDGWKKVYKDNVSVILQR